MGHIRRQAIAAQHDHIPIAQRAGDDVGLHPPFGAKGPGDHIAMGVILGLFGREGAAAHQLRHHRMVVGDLTQRAVTPQVGPRVAHMHQLKPVVLDQGGRNGGAHAGLLGVLLGEGPDIGVGRPHRVTDLAHGGRPPDRGHTIDGNLGRHLTGLGAAHAIGNRNHRSACQESVLVVVAHPAGVRNLGQLHQGEPRAQGLLLVAQNGLPHAQGVVHLELGRTVDTQVVEKAAVGGAQILHEVVRATAHDAGMHVRDVLVGDR